MCPPCLIHTKPKVPASTPRFQPELLAELHLNWANFSGLKGASTQVAYLCRIGLFQGTKVLGLRGP